MTTREPAVERNWAGNVTYGAVAFRHPTTIDELLSTVAGATAAGRSVKALGSRHSFSRVADTEGESISMMGLDRLVEIDETAMTVTVESGIRYGELGRLLHAAGYALGNLPSLPHITVGGAVATGTHGSGVAQPCVSATVVAMQVVTPDGRLVGVSRTGDPDTFPGMIVMSGRLGIVATLTLRIEPTYEVAQVVHLDLPIRTALTHLDEIMSAADSVSLFTDWQDDRIGQVWCKHRIRPGTDVDAAGSLFGARAADRPVHMVASQPTDRCTDQLGIAGPWHDRLPHFRLDFTPSVGDELQSEYFVDRADGAAAIEAVHRLRAVLAPVLLVSEIRTVAADDLWLSGAYDRDTIALHFTWIHDQPAVTETLAHLEAALAPFGARPHWGKLTAMSIEEVRTRFPRFDAAMALSVG